MDVSCVGTDAGEYEDGFTYVQSFGWLKSP